MQVMTCFPDPSPGEPQPSRAHSAGRRHANAAAGAAAQVAVEGVARSSDGKDLGGEPRRGHNSALCSLLSALCSLLSALCSLMMG